MALFLLFISSLVLLSDSSETVGNANDNIKFKDISGLLARIETICGGDDSCADDIMDDLIDYLYEGQSVGKSMFLFDNVRH